MTSQLVLSGGGEEDGDNKDQDPSIGGHIRSFLLVVGLGHEVLGALLQTGGCASAPEGVVRPDPFYVDQVNCYFTFYWIGKHKSGHTFEM